MFGMKQRLAIDVDRQLWRLVSIQAAKETITKREFVEQALREKLQKEMAKSE